MKNTMKIPKKIGASREWANKLSALPPSQELLDAFKTLKRKRYDNIDLVKKACCIKSLLLSHTSTVIKTVQRGDLSMNKMKKIVAIAAVLMGVMNTGFVRDSHALIGLAFKSKPVKVIGGIGTLGGVGVGLFGYGTALTATNLGVVIVGAAFTAYGIVIAGVGLVILDEKQIADIEFKAIDVSKSEQYVGFTSAQVETYNSELDLLNSIRQTVIAESNNEADTKDAEALWLTYAPLVSGDTFAIAKSKASEFLKVIR